MAEEFGSVSSSLVPFNTSIQNSALNPEAPEYYPIQSPTATTTDTTVSSGYFPYQQFNAAACCSSAVVVGQPYQPFPPPLPLHNHPFSFPPPPPTPSFYFPGSAPGPISPRLPLDPFNFLVAQPRPLSPSELIRYESQMMMMTQAPSQAVVNQNPDPVGAIPAAAATGGARRWFGRKRGSCYQWRVTSSRVADHRCQAKKYEEGESSSKILMKSGDEENGEEDSWRMVSYRSCRKKGMKYDIKLVEKDSKDTTLMIRNIPSRYSRNLMLEFLDNHCMQVNQRLLKQSSDPDADGGGGCGGPLSAYDFFYMPIDFKTGLNKSYAFVNFSTPEAVWRFYTDCDSKKWDHFQSNKIREIVVAELQGVEELMHRFDKSLFKCDFDEYLPVSFRPPRDGSADCPSITTIVGKRVPKPV